MKDVKTNDGGITLIMSASQKGGVAKSTSIAEFAAGYKSLGINPVVATVETARKGGKKNDYLERILRGTTVHEIDASSELSAGSVFGEVLDRAEASGGIVLLDVPGALFSQGNDIFARLIRTKLMEDVSKLILLAPVSNRVADFKYADMFIQDVLKFGLPVHDVWYRGWTRSDIQPALTGTIEWQKLSEAGKSAIEVEARHEGEMEVVEGDGDFASYPGLVELGDWYQTEGQNLPRFQRKCVEGILGSIDKVGAFIKVSS